MRRLSMVLASALVLALIVPGSAAAGRAATYHGDWVGTADVCGEAHTLTGIWNVIIQPDGTGIVTISMFSDDVHHASWGGNWIKQPWLQAAPTANEIFALWAKDLFGWGVDASFVLDKTGKLTYTLDPYCQDGTPASMVGRLLR